MRRLGWLGGVLALGVSLTCLRFGFWQVERHRQRAAGNRRIEERMALPAVDLVGAVGDSLEWRRIRVAGVFDRSRELVEAPRAVRGVPAVYVVTPLLMEDGRAILVERGWAPSADARSVDLSGVGEPDTTVAEGLLVRRALDAADVPESTDWPLVVRAADPVALSRAFPYPLAGLVLRRTVRPDGAPATLGTVPPPLLRSGPHLSYAVQWFIFATIAAVGPLVATAARRRPRDTDLPAPRV